MLLLGVQRSGTNALFKCLESGPGVEAHNEAPDGPFFERVLLRPMDELRPRLENRSRPLLLKPISESTRRPVAALLDEWAAYAPRAIWLYRDPVQVFHSHVERWQGFRDRPAAFAEHWSARNASALEALAGHGEALAIVRYEDLIADPAVFAALAAWCGLPGAYLFRADQGRGRGLQPAEVQALLDEACAPVLARLDGARRFRADAARPLARTTARALGRLRREWTKLSR